MAHIRKRADGRIEGILCFKGKHFSVYAHDTITIKKKILNKQKELQKQYKQEKTLAEQRKSITLETWYKNWAKTDKQPFVSKATFSSIENVFNNHILKNLGKIKLKDLDKNKIQNFLNQYEISRTKELITTYFKACITKAFKERLIDYNPFDIVTTNKKIKSDKQGFSADQQKSILEHLKSNDLEWYKIVLCYLCLGCRRTELCTLKPENIKNNMVLIEGTKTQNAKRYVNITPEFEKILFETIPQIKKYSNVWITKKFKKTLTTLNLKGSIHSLRHTFITNHYYLGTPAKQVQTWAGHASIQMTMDIYTKIDPTINPESEKNKILELYNNLYYYIKKT